MTSSISAWIWSETFWLPENVTWADLEHPPPGVEYPRVGQILCALPLALCVLVLRLLFERLVAKPCARILHIQAGVSRQAQPNAALERVYKSITCPDTRQLEGLSKQLDWDVQKIQRWFRLRRTQDRPSTLKKFCESMWRFTFYLGIFIYAIRHLWVSPWMWDTRQCWYNYPFQPLSPGQYNYYVAELAFYWSLMFSQFTDNKRKDFIIMLVHHLATITLITFSYANNMLRAGTLVMCVHDASDIFLEVKDSRDNQDYVQFRMFPGNIGKHTVEYVNMKMTPYSISASAVYYLRCLTVKCLLRQDVISGNYNTDSGLLFYHSD